MHGGIGIKVEGEGKMYSSNFMQMGKRILAVLNLKGKTVQELARTIGISEKTMIEIIKGYKAINVNEISKIAEALAVSVEDILTIDDQAYITESVIEVNDMPADGQLFEKMEQITDAIGEISMLEELIED